MKDERRNVVLKSVQHSLFKINGEFGVTPEISSLVGRGKEFEAYEITEIALKGLRKRASVYVLVFFMLLESV
ncbi:MAG: hypothetical protein ABI481_08680, partial [Pyrinomonadaceae bacterium]